MSTRPGPSSSRMRPDDMTSGSVRPSSQEQLARLEEWLCSPAFRAFARRVGWATCKADIDDLGQMVRMAYVKSPPAVEGPTSRVLAWAKSVAKNATIKQTKKRKLEQQWRADVAGEANGDVHHQALGTDLDWADRHARVVQRTLAAMGVKGEALRLQNLGWSYKQIADHLRTTVGAVTMMLHSGRLALLGDPAMASANAGRLDRKYASYGSDIVLVHAEVFARDGSTKTAALRTSPLLWHADGFVQADVEVPADWPSLLCAAVHWRGLRPEDGEISLVNSIPVQNGIASLEVFLGEPAVERVLRGPMPLPTQQITLLFAH